MADVTIDNGALTDFVIDTKKLSGNEHVQRIELVSAVESGASTDLAKAVGDAFAGGELTLSWAVRKDTAAILSGVADGDVTVPIVDSSGRLHVNAGVVPAAARTSDSVSAALAVDKLMSGLTTLTPTFETIDDATSGDNTIVAAQGSGNMILVHQVLLVASAAVTVRFESGTGGTALTGQMQLAANAGFVLPFSPVGWFRTAANALLNLELSGATSVDGVIAYTVVT